MGKAHIPPHTSQQHGFQFGQDTGPLVFTKDLRKPLMVTEPRWTR